MSLVKERIKEIQKIEKEGVNNSQRLWELSNLWKERGREHKRDREIYEQFRKNAEAGRKENNNRLKN